MDGDRIVARTRDLVRNDGWAAGAVTRILDSAIGADLRPIPKPDFKMLQQISGIKAFDHEWAKEFSRAVMSSWDTLGERSDCYCDSTRNQTFTR